MFVDSLDFEGRTEETLAVDEEVRRSDHTTSAAFRVIGLYVGLAHADVVHRRELADPQQLGRVGEVPTFFEERFTKRQADALTALQVSSVRSGGERERGQRTHGEELRSERGEEVGSDCCPKLRDLLDQEVPRYFCTVDDLEQIGRASCREREQRRWWSIDDEHTRV